MILNVDIGLIHAAVIKRDIDQVKILTELAIEKGQSNLEQLLKAEIQCKSPEGYKFTPQCSWISDATAIHLATSWDIQSLVHFLQACPNLSNVETKEEKFTPLHVAAAIDNNPRAVCLLIRKGANVNSRDSKGQTALHIASQCGSVRNVTLLLFEGKADPLAQDEEKKTPLHYPTKDKILEILLNKAKLDDLTNLSGENCLFDHILKRHPKCIETYLDLMVSSKNEDADILDKQYTFNFDTFNHDTTKESNFLDKHKKVIEAGYPEFLRHPVMMFFTELKWVPHRKKYWVNLFVFLSFLLTLTLHAIYHIDFLQLEDKCHNIRGEF